MKEVSGAGEILGEEIVNTINQIARKSETKEKKFPDGKSLSDYGRYKSWSYKRWAWEFLCRNTKFREACSSAAVSEDLQSKVAKEFGLVKFKNYKDVQTKSNVFPTFKDGAILTVPNLGNKKQNKLVSIFSGQVFIRFKLKTDVNTIAAIDAQLERARQHLYKLAGQYNQNVDGAVVSIKPAFPIDPLSLVQYLRILDLKAGGIVSPKEIATYLYEAKFDTKQHANIENLTRTLRGSKKIEHANMLPIQGYRYLALKLGRPI